MGVNYIDLYPYYPGIEKYSEDIKLAITPGEQSLVPSSVKEVIDLGNRVVDGSTIFEILNTLDLLNNITKERLLNYFFKILPENLGLLELIKNSNHGNEYLQTILIG